MEQLELHIGGQKSKHDAVRVKAMVPLCLAHSLPSGLARLWAMLLTAKPAAETAASSIHRTHAMVARGNLVLLHSAAIGGRT